jgi:hypothetical protein
MIELVRAIMKFVVAPLEGALNLPSIWRSVNEKPVVNLLMLCEILSFRCGALFNA